MSGRTRGRVSCGRECGSSGRCRCGRCGGGSSVRRITVAPSRERGLKQIYEEHQGQKMPVTPFTGAWIETHEGSTGTRPSRYPVISLQMPTDLIGQITREPIRARSEKRSATAWQTKGYRGHFQGKRQKSRPDQIFVLAEPLDHRVSIFETERGGFEPPIGFKPNTAFPVLRLRPLGHLSSNSIPRLMRSNAGSLAESLAGFYSLGRWIHLLGPHWGFFGLDGSGRWLGRDC
jgi:hypothetical protein